MSLSNAGKGSSYNQPKCESMESKTMDRNEFHRLTKVPDKNTKNAINITEIPIRKN